MVQLCVKAVKLSMPRQGLGMRPVGLDLRHLKLARGVNDRLDTFAVIDLAVHDKQSNRRPFSVTADIAFGKLEMHLRNVVRDRPIFVHKKSEGH